MRKLFLLLFLLLPFTAKAQTAKECILVSAASTNATNCTAQVTNLVGYTFVNTTATIYYLRIYNLATTPTCSSATGFVRSIPLLATSSTVIDWMKPTNLNAGLGFCLTGGGSSTDNTNAAVGVYGVLRYTFR